MSVSQISHLVEFDFEELDDREFAIPSIDGPLPTLESILNEPDIDSIASDFELDGIQSQSRNELLESADNCSISSLSHSKNHNHNQTKSTSHGSVVRHSVLKGLSAQLKSANSDRVKAGKPTVISISNCYVAIGTSHGFVLVFDLRQVMKWCLRNSDDFGSVSALSLKRDNSRLICGYSRGHVTVWNLQSGELIKVYNELHSPQTTVLHLKYLSDNNFAVLSDSSGSVFMIDFRRKEVDSQCIFSGSRGEVLAVDPLLLPINAKGEIVNFSNICLLSMATVTKVIAISVRPSVNVHFTQLLKGDSDTLPLLCWQFVMVQVEENARVIDPVLSFARQNHIYFFQASFKSNTKVVFTPLIHIKVDYIVQHIVWLNSRTLVTVDKLEQLHVLDVRSEEELEVIDIAKVELVYSSAHFKSLSTGGLVSAAMAAAGERACYHSICISNSTLSNTSSAHLLILGMNSVHLFVIRSWNERIDLLVEQNKYCEALSMALSFYNNKAKAVVGLSGKKNEKRIIIAEKIMEILNSYVDVSLTNMCPEKGKIEVLFEHYRNFIPICIDYSLAIEQQDLLFSKLFDKFSADAIAKNIFLETLEHYILNGQLKTLSPVIVKELVSHYAENKWFHALETIVTHLEITSLDIHQIMTLCWKYSLFDAIIYIHNQAFDDYITPFEELIKKLQKAIIKGKQFTDNEINLGKKLLIYISCSLTGRTYPNKVNIQTEKKTHIIREILTRITKFRNNNHENGDNDKSCGSNSVEDAIYPYLRTLLSFDTNEFLNVLSIAFENFDSEDNSLTHQKQRIVDILLLIMVENSGFTPTQIGSLFLFLARQLAIKQNTIFVNNTLFDQIIEYLTDSGDKTRFEERQQALLDLIQANANFTLRDDKVLKMAEKAKFYRVCEYIHIKNRNWGQNLCCYLKDTNKKPQIYSYINQIILSSSLTEEEKSDFMQTVFSNMKSLTEIDNKRAANLLLDYLDNENKFTAVLNSLENEPKVLYKLLYGILLGFNNRYHTRDASTGSINLESLSAREQRKQTLMSDPLIQERFIELMCKLEPNSVCKSLMVLEGYRLEIALVMCKQYNISNATAYLLEKNGKYEEAFAILFNELNEIIKNFVETDVEEVLAEIGSKMSILIEFCQRCSSKILESKDRETFWFTLLESMMTVKQLIKSLDKSHPLSANYSNKLKELTDKLLNGMIGNIDLLSLLQRIINDPLYSGESGGKLCDIRELLMGMLDTYNYEETLLQTTNNLLLNELHQQLSQLRKDVNKAHSNRSTICSVCLQPLYFEDNVIVFRCSHSFHSKCMNGNEKLPKCQFCDATDANLESQKRLRRISLSSESKIDANDQTLTTHMTAKSHSLKLHESQINALEYLRKCQKIDSRAHILNTLPNTGIRLSTSDAPTDDIYKLKLAPQWKRTID